jgi:hypothetical protein
MVRTPRVSFVNIIPQALRTLMLPLQEGEDGEPRAPSNKVRQQENMK